MLGYRGIVASQQAAGTLFNTYTTAKTVINPQALWTIPAGALANLGQIITVDVWGGISSLTVTPGTVTFQCMIGNIVAFTTGAIQLNATAHTTLPFHLKVALTLRAVGSVTSANFMGMAEVAGVMFTKTAAQVDGVNSETIIQVPATAPAVGTGFDSTIANVFDFWTGFSISNAANGVQVQQYIISSDN